MPQNEQSHKLSLEGRQKLSITGVTEVLSFDDTTVMLRTALGDLMVGGSQLQLKTLSLDGGQVDVDGQISLLQYEEPKAGGNFWRRLFG
jgi:sporulation protein YabP